MKVLARILSLFMLLAVATLYTSCGGDDGPTKTQEETQLDKLKADVWNIASASLGTTDRTGDFTNLKLTFSGNYVAGGTYGYSLSGTRPNPSPWPASGTWKFGSNVTSQIVRLDDDPDLGMNYVLTDTQLTITFTYTGAGFAGGRIEQVEGDWEFIFTK